MDEQTRAKITELLLEQAGIDLAKEQQCTIASTPQDMNLLLWQIAKTPYAELHPAWAIPLWLGRN